MRTFGGSIHWILPWGILLVTLLGRWACLAFVEAFHVTTMSPTIVPIFESLDWILVVVAVVVASKAATLSNVITILLVAPTVPSKVIVVGAIITAVSLSVIVVAARIVLVAESLLLLLWGLLEGGTVECRRCIAACIVDKVAQYLLRIV